jgi:hypothetical protein
MLGVACAPDRPSSTTPVVTLEGTFRGGIVDEWGCFWVVEPDGRRTLFYLPENWWVDLNEMVIYDATETVVASQGDAISVTGELWADGSVCGPRVRLVATEIVGSD